MKTNHTGSTVLATVINFMTLMPTVRAVNLMTTTNPDSLFKKLKLYCLVNFLLELYKTGWANGF